MHSWFLHLSSTFLSSHSFRRINCHNMKLCLIVFNSIVLLLLLFFLEGLRRDSSESLRDRNRKRTFLLRFSWRMINKRGRSHDSFFMGSLKERIFCRFRRFRIPWNVEISASEELRIYRFSLSLWIIKLIFGFNRWTIPFRDIRRPFLIYQFTTVRVEVRTKILHLISYLGKRNHCLFLLASW